MTAPRIEKTYECGNGCGRKYIAAEARPVKWICHCGGKIVASWWGKHDEEVREQRRDLVTRVAEVEQ